jgi:Tol biopolymer transport system component
VRRASPTAAWGVPEPVIELDPSTTPEITRDGLTIYIGSRRPGGVGGDDIWVATRPNRTALWALPVHVDELSSPSTDTNATPSDDHLALVFVQRTGSATGADIYATQRASTEDPWDPPVELSQLTSTTSDGDPMLSSDGLEIYFYSTRTAGGDLYVARRDRITDPFRTPELITELNSDALDQDPWISPDGRHLFFASDRDGTLAIYEATR